MFSLTIVLLVIFCQRGSSTPEPAGRQYPSSTSSPISNTTADIFLLQYILTLENFGATFYQGALTKFTQADFVAAGLTARDYQIITEVRDHTNINIFGISLTLTGLGATPVPVCTYNFPYTDVKSFLILARIFETTAVSAYNDVAKDISNDPVSLTAGATVVTVHARHAAFFNYITGKTPAPNPFDIPLGQRQIISIAGQFITSCPYTLPTPFPALSISPSMGNGGITLTLTTTAAWTGASCAFITGSGTNWLVPVMNGACVVPATLTGDVYVVLTSAATVAALSDANTLAGLAAFTVPDLADT